MAGYRWRTWIRMTPKDGLAEVLDLGFPYPGGFLANSVLVSAEPTYREVLESRETIERRLRPLILGYRKEVRLRFDVIDTDPDAAVVGKIARRLMDPYWTVELSLDDERTYHEIVLRSAPGPDPLGGKTIAGARLELRVMTKEAIRNYPDIRTGTSW